MITDEVEAADVAPYEARRGNGRSSCLLEEDAIAQPPRAPHVLIARRQVSLLQARIIELNPPINVAVGGRLGSSA
jgi:hypothetical protein